MSDWKETKEAAELMQCHPVSLKRRRDVNGGFLEEGRHWRFKFDSSNSPIMWNLPVIQQLFHERGVQSRKERAAEKVIKDLQQGG